MLTAAMAIAEGRFDEATSVAEEMRDIGGRHNLSVALAHSAQLQAMRAELGRTDDVIRSLSSLAVNAPPVSIAWRAMLAGLYADIGSLDHAAEIFESLASRRFALVPRDWTFPLAIRYLSETCVYLGDSNRAEELLPEVQAYSGQLLVVTQGTSIEAADDRSLGQLYAVLGRLEEADQCYQAAERLEDSMGFVPLAARTRFWRARLWSPSDDVDDRRRVLTLLRATQATTSTLGMKLLENQANSLYRRLTQGRAATVD
jgi:tetratricopeptide (TPR) repeat protein